MLLLQLPLEVLERILNFVPTFDVFTLAYRTGNRRLTHQTLRGTLQLKFDYRLLKTAPRLLPQSLASFERLETVKIRGSYNELRPDWVFLVSLPPSLKHLSLNSVDSLKSFFIPGSFGFGGSFKVREGLILKEMWCRGPIMLDIGRMWPKLETFELESWSEERWMPRHLLVPLLESLGPFVNKVSLASSGNSDFDPSFILPESVTSLEAVGWSDNTGACFQSSFNKLPSLTQLKFSNSSYGERQRAKLPLPLPPLITHLTSGSKDIIFEDEANPCYMLPSRLESLVLTGDLRNLDSLAHLPKESLTSLSISNCVLAEPDFVILLDMLRELKVTVGFPMRNCHWPTSLTSLQAHILHRIPMTGFLKSLPSSALKLLDLSLPRPLCDEDIGCLPTGLTSLSFSWELPHSGSKNSGSLIFQHKFPSAITELVLDGPHILELSKLIQSLPPRIARLLLPSTEVHEKHLNSLPCLADFNCRRLQFDGFHLPPSTTEFSATTLRASVAPLISRITSRDLHFSYDPNNDHFSHSLEMVACIVTNTTPPQLAGKLTHATLPIDANFDQFLGSLGSQLKSLRVLGTSRHLRTLYTSLNTTPNLTSIDAPSISMVLLSNSLPHTLTHISMGKISESMTDSLSRCKHLVSLELAALTFDLNSHETLPATLTNLSIRNLLSTQENFGWFKRLPAMLQTLDLPSARIRVTDIMHLPKSLKSLFVESLDLEELHSVIGPETKTRISETFSPDCSFNFVATQHLQVFEELHSTRHHQADIFENLLDSHLEWLLHSAMISLEIKGNSAEHLTTACFSCLPRTLTDISIGCNKATKFQRDLWSGHTFTITSEDDFLASKHAHQLPPAVTSLHYLSHTVGPCFVENLPRDLAHLSLALEPSPHDISTEKKKSKDDDDATSTSAAHEVGEAPSNAHPIYLWPQSLRSLVLICAHTFHLETSSFLPSELLSLYIYETVGSSTPLAFPLPEKLEALSHMALTSRWQGLPSHVKQDLKYHRSASMVAPLRTRSESP